MWVERSVMHPEEQKQALSHALHSSGRAKELVLMQGWRMKASGLAIIFIVLTQMHFRKDV